MFTAFTVRPGRIAFDLRLLYHTSFQIVYLQFSGVHQEAEGLNESLSRPVITHYVGFCASDVSFYQIPSGNHNSLPPCASLALSIPLSVFSFSIHRPDEAMGRNAKSEMMCPRFPEPLPLEHPIPSLKEALEKVRGVVHRARI